MMKNKSLKYDVLIGMSVLIGFASIIWMSTLSVKTEHLVLNSQAEMTLTTEVKNKTPEELLGEDFILTKCKDKDITFGEIKEKTKDLEFDLLIFECDGNLFTIEGNE